MTLQAGDSRAVLTRELRVRVIDVSGSGCLIESGRRLEIGTVGTLRLQLGTEEYADDVVVLRCKAVEGIGSLYQIGVRFLWTTPRHPGSIRHAVARHVADPPDTTCVM
jgi:PilZ domain